MVGLLALGAVDACGSRSPLVGDFGEGFAGEHETGGSGGSVGGAGGSLGGGVGGVGGVVEDETDDEGSLIDGAGGG